MKPAQVRKSAAARGVQRGGMMLALMVPTALVALLMGISIASGATTPTQLYVGLTFVICAVMVLCTCAIVIAVAALRDPAAVPPARPPQQQGNHPLS
jgi:hypothetical protein